MRPVPQQAPVWSRDELLTLERLYPDHTNEEIAAILNRTPGSVKIRAVMRGLRKSREFSHRSRSRPRPRKSVGCIPNPLPVIDRLLRRHGYIP